MILALLGRLGSALAVIWAAATLGFVALNLLPGDAIETQLRLSGVDADTIAERRAELGLTASAGERYVRFLLAAVRGDLGESWLSGEDVTQAIARNLLPTATLAIGALVVACVLGILLGVAAALAIPVVSASANILLQLSLSMPIYWTGTLAIFLFTVQLGLLPSAGAGRLSQLVLPVLVLGYHTTGAIARVLQSNIREALREDFVRTARAKGLSERRVLGVHVLRVAMLPVISVIGLQAGFLFSGAVITESLFVRPGIGRLLLDSVIQQDYPVVLGIVILAGTLYVTASLVADMALRFLDPRVTL